VLLQYDGVVNIIRRGDFKKLDQELETGWKRGMFNFEKSVELRAAENFRSTIGYRTTGFGWDEVENYLENQTEVSR
jgi:twitching motility protein PilT